LVNIGTITFSARTLTFVLQPFLSFSFIQEPELIDSAIHVPADLMQSSSEEDSVVVSHLSCGDIVCGSVLVTHHPSSQVIDTSDDEQEEEGHDLEEGS
jgi:hypothetical protein